MEWLSTFLSENGSALLTGATAGMIAWAATHALVKPISLIRDKRLEVLQLAERYARLRSSAGEERIGSARSSMADAAAAMRALSRGRVGVVNLYCWFRGYDLETAVLCLNGLTTMIGYYSFPIQKIADAIT